MNIGIVLFLLAAALLLRLLMQFGHRREWMLAASVLAIFWLQPEIGIRTLAFWFPVGTLFLIILAWLFVTPSETRKRTNNQQTVAYLILACVGLAGTRYVGVDSILLAATPPSIRSALLGIALMAGLGILAAKTLAMKKGTASALAIFILLMFLFLKMPTLSTLISSGLRLLNHQNPSLAHAGDLTWLGYSYIAFRLIHTLRDHQTGRLPGLPLRDYMLYVLFFPTLQAGPIDRITRFENDLSDQLQLNSEDFLIAGQRIAMGLLKKFVLADSLAMIALTDQRIFQIKGSGWMWLSLVAYSFLIYFDFSGYTDIAIGLARLLGVQTPENFNRPYRRQNLTLFWNNWHITLTQWFRAYFFNPVTRKLRRSSRPLPTWLAILIPQVGTMLLIGLWHGITWNFAFWGIWHGVGLFVQNRWSGWVKRHGYFQFPGVFILNICLTFTFVSLGWVFFLSHDISSILRAFSVLFGRS